MRPIKIHLIRALECQAQRHADARGMDVPTFITEELAEAFNQGVLPFQQYDPDEDYPWVTDPGGGIWHEDDLPDDPDDEVERLLRDLMAEAARKRRLH